MKLCTRCEHEKPLGEFVRSSRSSDGRGAWCLLCHGEAERARRQADPETAHRKDREQYDRKKRKPGFLAQKRLASRARSAAARTAEWYRAKFPGVAESYIRALLNDPCAYCGKRPAGAVDHIEPTSLGGSDGFANLVGCCSSCNPAKSNKPLLLFLAHRNGCWTFRQDATPTAAMAA